MSECPTCHGAGEVTSSTTPNLDPRDPAHCTRTDPCGCQFSPYAPPDVPTDCDPMFDIVLMAAAGAEDEARDAYGDRVVDSAIGRVLGEEGWQ